MADEVEEDLTEETPAATPDPEPPKPEWTEAEAEEAKAFGWKAPEEWTGEKPAGYIDDPRRYLDRAENFRPFKVLKDRLTAKEAEFDERIRKLDGMSAQAMAALQAQHDAEKTRLTAQQRAAVEVGDVAQYDDLSKQIAAMKPVDVPKPEPKPADGPDPYVAEYAAKNEWVKDPVLYDFARNAIDVAARSGVRWNTVAEQVAYAEAKAKEYFPHKFAAPVTQPVPLPSRVDGGGLGAWRSDPLARLKPEAQAQFRRDVKAGLYKDDAAGRASWAEEYNNA